MALDASPQPELLSLRGCIKQGVKQLYQSQQLCDVTLVAEGRKFPCHRAILASVSLYFQRMFTGSFKESREREIVLHNLPAVCLQSLLDYVCTGELQVMEEAAEELFTAASRLQITPAIELISRFLAERISAESCLDLYALAHSHNHRPLLRAALRHIAFHLQDLAQCPAFLSLDSSVLVSIIASNSLSVDSELVVHRAVHGWLRHDPAERLRKAAELMGHVRLPLLTPEELAEVRSGANKSCKRVWLPWEELSAGQRLQASGGLRRGMYRPGVVCVGQPLWRERGLGNEGLPCFLHFFDPSTEQWEELPDPTSVAMPGCVSMGHKLYVAGGQQRDGFYSSRLCVYDTLRGRWARLPSMSSARCCHAFLGCKKRLYAVGGDGNAGPLLCAESFDLEREEWAAISSLPFALSNLASTRLGGKLYLIGGERGSDLPVPHRGLLVYDTASDAWSHIPTVLDFYGARAVTLDNGIFVVGGWVQNGTHGKHVPTGRCVCLLQDGTVNPDVRVPSLPIEVPRLGVVRWQRRIYVFGGNRHELCLTAMHYWEPGQPHWTKCSARVPDPHLLLCGFQCVPLKLPREKLRALFQRGDSGQGSSPTGGQPRRANIPDGRRF